MKGTISHELEVGVPAGMVWGVYSTRRLAELVIELMPDIVAKVEFEQGDGGEGSVVGLTFAPGLPGPQFYREKFVKIDDEKRMKEAVVIEGGYLDLGFLSYLVRFEILEKNNNSSTIRSTIEYEIAEEHAANASFATIGPLVATAETVAKYLLEKKDNVA